MLEFFTHLFDTSGFPPRWQCGSWSEAHGWLHILSDLGIWSAYFAIPLILVTLVLRRRDVPFPTIFWLFGAFILACGTTHLMEAIIFWHPIYRLAGVIKLLTALVSWCTVVALVPVVPKALAMRTPEELEKEIAARKQAEQALQQANAELERRVQQRTEELAQANAALQKERDRFRTTLSSIGDAVITTDFQGRVTFLNGVAKDLTGWPKDEAIGRPLDEVFRIVNENTRQPAANPVSRVLREGSVVGLANHTVLIAKDGPERPIDDSAAPIRDEDERIVGVVLVFRDVTVRRRAEEALRRTTEQLQIVTESMSAPITRCSRDLRYLWVSKPYGGWIGRPAEEIIDHPIIDIIGPEAFEQLRPHFERVLAGQIVRYEQQVQFRGIGPRWINAVYTPTTDAAGVPDGWVAVVIDVDERKRMEQALRAGEESLREADRRKNEFLATLAHELRNPLAPIRNALELMRYAQGNNPAIVGQAQSIMERQLQHMVRLIDDLLDISRITSGKLQIRKERVRLAEVVQSALEASRPTVEAESHELTVTLPEEPIYLDADPTRLAQMFSNLLNNAAKYTERGGHIWLTAERQGGQAVVSVRDTGVGIPAEHLPHLFKMFSQVAPALERSQGGLGIGLALVRGLVELHGGSIEAFSSPGKGSEFIVRLPALEGPAPVPSEKTQEGQPAGSEAILRILVADDNRDTADSLALMLRMMGHETQAAYDGVEAVQMAAGFRPDLALLDIGMPKMNGYEVAKQIRQQPWGKRMILVASTGWGQEEDKRRATEAGFHYHLTKPVEPAALANLLEALSQSRN